MWRLGWVTMSIFWSTVCHITNASHQLIACVQTRASEVVHRWDYTRDVELTLLWAFIPVQVIHVYFFTECVLVIAPASTVKSILEIAQHYITHMSTDIFSPGLWGVCAFFIFYILRESRRRNNLLTLLTSKWVTWQQQTLKTAIWCKNNPDFKLSDVSVMIRRRGKKTWRYAVMQPSHFLCVITMASIVTYNIPFIFYINK